MNDELKRLQDDVRNLEIQVATLSKTIMQTKTKNVEVWDLPRVATDKCQRCKNCKNMRMPHKSNPHYTCYIRHTTIESAWTCELFSDKKNQRISEAPARCGH